MADYSLSAGSPSLIILQGGMASAAEAGRRQIGDARLRTQDLSSFRRSEREVALCGFNGNLVRGRVGCRYRSGQMIGRSLRRGKNGGEQEGWKQLHRIPLPIG